MTHRPVLTVNAGSTSTKLAVVGDEASWSCTVGPGEDALADALQTARPFTRHLGAVGHRVVHGGGRFVQPVRIDDEMLTAIGAANDLAPLHNRAAIASITLARAEFPQLPHVACFDTAFHVTIPPAAYTYGGPYRWLEQGLRRYGFHGLSHQYATGRTATLLGRRVEELRLVSCHLGGGCSLAAVAGGKSVDTTMGLTPLDGLVMATRSGSVDPGLLLHCLRQGTSIAELDDTLEHHAGLLGLSGVSGDLPEVMTARDHGDSRAALAVDVFVHRLAGGIGAMIAALDGLDAIVFTGGIGEHNPEIRARAVRPFAWLGIDLDNEVNDRTHTDADIAMSDATVRTLVVTSREELVIARATQALVT